MNKESQIGLILKRIHKYGKVTTETQKMYMEILHHYSEDIKYSIESSKKKLN